MSSHLPIRRTLCQCVRSNPGSALRHFPQRQQTRLLSSSRSLRAAANPLRNASRSGRKSHTEYKRSIVLSAAGMASCAVAMFGVINIYFPQGVQKDDSKDGIDNGAIKLDGPPGLAPKDDSTTLKNPEHDYLLVLRAGTVTSLLIVVYDVAFCNPISDLQTLHVRLGREAAPPSMSGVLRESAETATSLAEEVWIQIHKEGGIRTAIRIVPTRNTDFLHLRDGWVRAITGRAQRANVRAKALASKELDAQPQSEFADDSFGEAMGDFKALLGGGGGGRKSVPKGQTLLLLRDKVGALEILYQPGDAKPSVWLGEVLDERISRLLWLQYLAGKVVASDGARRAIIDEYGISDDTRLSIGFPQGVSHDLLSGDFGISSCLQRTSSLEQSRQFRLAGLQVRVSTDVLVVDEDVGNGALVGDLLESGLDSGAIIWMN
ncbi:hypothetical protein CIHG_02902 [Coccidioides immitis H538.4]|uniref:Chalcone isomerase domain-containing protein n=1 Tax=Coccidioides immitis H538.4 TaxID=396776 RepID=A0A0J8RJ32_COCIT|nr:hypothetical protein CIHG_02902 [Coccidioides immitis H538.4]